MPAIKSNQRAAYAALLFRSGVELLRGGRRSGAKEAKERFVAISAVSLSKLVEGATESNPVEPPFLIPCLRRRTAQKLQEILHGELLSAGRLTHNAGY